MLYFWIGSVVETKGHYNIVVLSHSLDQWGMLNSVLRSPKVSILIPMFFSVYISFWIKSSWEVWVKHYQYIKDNKLVLCHIKTDAWLQYRSRRGPKTWTSSYENRGTVDKWLSNSVRLCSIRFGQCCSISERTVLHLGMLLYSALSHGQNNTD